MVKIGLVVILVALPLIFLLYKTADYWKSGPSFSDYINQSVSYINSNQPEKAIEPLQKAIKIEPKSAVAYNNLGVAYNLIKRYDDGIAACRKAVELDPNFQLAKNNLNWGLSEKKKL